MADLTHFCINISQLAVQTLSASYEDIIPLALAGGSSDGPPVFLTARLKSGVLQRNFCSIFGQFYIFPGNFVTLTPTSCDLLFKIMAGKNDDSTYVIDSLGRHG